MSLDDPNRARVHLLTMLEGERFALEPGPSAEVYTLRPHQFTVKGKPVDVLRAHDQTGVAWQLIEVCRKNGCSYFVYPAGPERGDHGRADQQPV